jgi:hypothetical protein
MLATSETQFNAAYWASKSQAILDMVAKIRACPTSEGDGPRFNIAINTATELIAAGRTDPPDLVDSPIMVWLWSPWRVMTQLIDQGETTVLDGTGKYPIKVSIDLNDYPVYQV